MVDTWPYGPWPPVSEQHGHDLKQHHKHWTEHCTFLRSSEPCFQRFFSKEKKSSMIDFRRLCVFGSGFIVHCLYFNCWMVVPIIADQSTVRLTNTSIDIPWIRQRVKAKVKTIFAVSTRENSDPKLQFCPSRDYQNIPKHSVLYDMQFDWSMPICLFQCWSYEGL